MSDNIQFPLLTPAGKIAVKSKNNIYALCPEDILYVQKSLRQIFVFTKHNTCPIVYYGKINELSDLLDTRFMLCHSSYIINMDEIIEINSEGIVISNNDRIHLGRDSQIIARKCYIKYTKLFAVK